MKTKMNPIVLLLPLPLIILISHVHSQHHNLIRNYGNFTVEAPSEIEHVDYLTFVGRSRYFIDKTMLINSILVECKDYTVILLAYPLRWGKTLQLKMLKAFFEVTVDKDGFKVLRNKTRNYQLFTSGRIDQTFNTRTIDFDRPLAIASHKKLVNNYQGKFPVIYIDFDTVGGHNHSDFVRSLKVTLRDVFRQHKYLLKRYAAANRTNPADLQTYDNIMTGEEDNEEVLGESLFLLSKLLKLFFNRQVIMLIDNYDTLLNSTICNWKYVDPERTEKLYLNLLRTALQDNRFIEKAVIMGKLKLHQLNLSPDFNFIHEFSITQYNFVQYFGFNQLEVNSIFDNHSITPKGRKDAEKWYNGYQLGASSTMKIYNAWSVMNYATFQTLSIWWARNQGVNYILTRALNLFFFENAIAILLSHSIYFISLIDFQYGLKDFQRSFRSDSDQYINTNIALEYLLSLGYLTLNGTYTGEACLSQIPVQVPNEEVHKALLYKSLNHFRKKLKIPKTIDYPTHFDYMAQQLNVCATLENSTCDRLRIGTERFLGELPPFVPLNRDYARFQNIRQPDDLMIRTLFNFMFIFTDVFRFLGFNELLFESNKTGIGLIIKYNNSLTGEELGRAQDYYRSCFQKVKHLEKMKTIEITVTPDKKVKIRNQLF